MNVLTIPNGYQGAYDVFLDMQTIDLPGDFNDETLMTMRLTDNRQVFYHSGILMGVTVVPEPAAIVDIKPESFPNSVNLKSNGFLPVAILGTDVFDVDDPNTGVDISTLLFGDPNSGTPLFPVRSAIEDVNVDGFEDLSLKFSVADLVESGALGPLTMEGLLTGALLDGAPFAGMDSIRIVPPSFSSAPLIAAVPEPTTSALALAALCLAMSRRRAF